MMTTLTHESSHKDTCLHPYTRCHAHTARSDVRVFDHNVNLPLDNICLFVHDVEPPWSMHAGSPDLHHYKNDLRPTLQERLPTGSPPDLPKSDGTPGAHELIAGSSK